MMVPLRRYLIVKEHGVLRYPEGKACAEILEAGEKGGTSREEGLRRPRRRRGVQGVPGDPRRRQGQRSRTAIPGFKGAALDCDVAPELLGVGYIIGYRTSVMMVAGVVLASLILVPMIVLFGSRPRRAARARRRCSSATCRPATLEATTSSHIGAGAVAAGGIFALVRALPSIVSSIARLGQRAAAAAAWRRRGRRCARTATRPSPVLVVGALAIVAFIWARARSFHMNLLGAVLIVVLGFLFSVVSLAHHGRGRLVLLPALRDDDRRADGDVRRVPRSSAGRARRYSRLALMVGAVVCIAISNAGTCSQDLKTGFLVGATPVQQQGALLVGVLTSVLAVGWTAYLLNLARRRRRALAKPFAGPRRALVADGENDRVAHGREDLRVRAPRARTRCRRASRPASTSSTARRRGADPAARTASAPGRSQAPQAKLMAVVIDGLLDAQAALGPDPDRRRDRRLHRAAWASARSRSRSACTCRSRSTMPVFLGGLVRAIADKVYKREPDAEDEPEGTLWCSGLIAGASILGILAAMQGFLEGFKATRGFTRRSRSWTSGCLSS